MHWVTHGAVIFYSASGANPTITSYNASVVKIVLKCTGLLRRLNFLQCFRGQSYGRELQRQRCKNLQRN
jgi:hypothetical protein